MKKLWSLPVFFLFLAACSSGSDPDDGNNDDSPGVDEYFHMTLDGAAWEVEPDSLCGSAVGNFGSGPLVVLSATRMSDSSHITYNIPYFYGTDTTFTIPPAIALAYFAGDGSAYNAVSGTFHISRSTSGSLEVYEGTFDLVYEEVFTSNTVQVTNGAFRVARLL